MVLGLGGSYEQVPLLEPVPTGPIGGNPSLRRLLVSLLQNQHARKPSDAPLDRCADAGLVVDRAGILYRRGVERAGGLGQAFFQYAVGRRLWFTAFRGCWSTMASVVSRASSSSRRSPRCRGTSRPSPHRADDTVGGVVEVDRLLASADSERVSTRKGFRAFVALCAFAGLRLGEASGVQVRDIDFLRRELKVSRQIQRDGSGYEVAPPKCRSERAVSLPDDLPPCWQSTSRRRRRKVHRSDGSSRSAVSRCTTTL